MSTRDAEELSPEILAELRRAETFSRGRAWMEADLCYSRATELDTSPTSRIAFGTSLANRERYHDAICQLTGALEVASQTGNREALGVVYHNLAAIYRELEDADLARRFQQRAIQQLEDCGPSELLGLANDAWLNGGAELAACLSSSCTDLEDESTDKSELLEAQAATAVFSGMTDDPRMGIRSLIHAYRRHFALNELKLMGIDLLNLSALLSEMGWYQAEIRLVRQAIRHFEDGAALVSAARARKILARLLRVQSLRDFDPSMN